ncbi:MAG: flagellar assembly protein FliW [Firmicutes bacterium]|jgi:flagellar assembly factor FliW|nr:flagellar assembly protein FliW [Bacillota bacterium]
MIIKSTRLGELTAEAEQIITFPRGLPGFERERQFVICDHPGSRSIKWLQSACDPDLALVLVDPFEFYPDYHIDIPEDQAGEVLPANADELAVMSVLTVRPELTRTTANLVAPIVVNRTKRLGVQVILQGTCYSTRHPLVPVAEGRAGYEARCS